MYPGIHNICSKYFNEDNNPGMKMSAPLTYIGAVSIKALKGCRISPDCGEIRNFVYYLT
jgi:hypothetical protein